MDEKFQLLIHLHCCKFCDDVKKYLLFNVHVLKKFVVRVSIYDLLLPKSSKALCRI